MDCTPLIVVTKRCFLKNIENRVHYWGERLKDNKWFKWCLKDYGFPGDSVVKNLPANAGGMGLIPGSGRSPGWGNGTPLQYSYLGNPWTEEPGGLQSMGSQRVRHNLVTKWTTTEDYGNLYCYLFCILCRFFFFWSFLLLLKKNCFV